MPHDTRTDDPIAEAILLGERDRELARTSNLERLCAIAPHVDTGLEDEPEPFSANARG